MKRYEQGYDILKEFVSKLFVFLERLTVKNQATSVLCSTLESCY